MIVWTLGTGNWYYLYVKIIFQHTTHHTGMHITRKWLGHISGLTFCSCSSAWCSWWPRGRQWGAAPGRRGGLRQLRRAETWCECRVCRRNSRRRTSRWCRCSSGRTPRAAPTLCPPPEMNISYTFPFVLIQQPVVGFNRPFLNWWVETEKKEDLIYKSALLPLKNNRAQCHITMWNYHICDNFHIIL